jgi:hypothetical protein
VPGSKTLGVFIASVLHSEVVNNKTKDNRLGGMGRETGSVLCLYVAELGEMLDVPIVSELAGFENTLHTFADLTIMWQL